MSKFDLSDSRAHHTGANLCKPLQIRISRKQSMNLPRARILSTGSEITQGLYPDTNAQNLSRLLFDNGFEVIGHGAAPDNPALIRRALEHASADCELLVMTGGLGPTEDDLNREIVAELCGIGLSHDAKAEAMMRERFDRRGVAMPQRNVKQANLPAGSVPLYNYWGTAPGFIVPAADGRAAIVALPGPPSEWTPMFTEALAGPLGGMFPGRPRRKIHTLHIAMTPESTINEAIRDLFSGEQETDIGILAKRGQIRIRLIATGDSDPEIQRRIDVMRAAIVDRIGPELIYAEGDEQEVTLEQTLVRLMAERGLTLSLAESCTGGGVAQAVTDIPGSSAVLLAGYVTYSNDAKMRDLGVPAGVLDTDGAVSEATARAMAEGARERAGTDWALSITGVAGPTGGTPEKPVGTIWFGVAGPEGTETRKRVFSGDRAAIREFTVRQGLELVRRAILRINLDVLLAPRLENRRESG